jgi:hypothetical protein
MFGFLSCCLSTPLNQMVTLAVAAFVYIALLAFWETNKKPASEWRCTTSRAVAVAALCRCDDCPAALRGPAAAPLLRIHLGCAMKRVCCACRRGHRVVTRTAALAPLGGLNAAHRWCLRAEVLPRHHTTVSRVNSPLDAAALVEVVAAATITRCARRCVRDCGCCDARRARCVLTSRSACVAASPHPLLTRVHLARARDRDRDCAGQRTRIVFPDAETPAPTPRAPSPSPTGRAVSPVPLPRASPAKPSPVPAAAAAAAQSSSAADTGSDSGSNSDASSSDDDAPKTKTRRTPVRRTPAKKTPARAARSQSPAAAAARGRSKTPTRSKSPAPSGGRRSPSTLPRPSLSPLSSSLASRLAPLASRLSPLASPPSPLASRLSPLASPLGVGSGCGSSSRRRCLSVSSPCLC